MWALESRARVRDNATQEEGAPMGKEYVLAMDQGTTSSRSILFNRSGQIVASAWEEYEQIYPRPGWVEHDPLAIWETQRSTAERVLHEANAGAGDVATIGITNQRETVVVWERSTGLPIHNAIVWQCRRTADRCEELKKEGLADEIAARTGLVVDAYFSGTKIAWILDHVEGARERAKRGELCAGTIDSWLLYKLGAGHKTDASNASRTMLFNIHGMDWDDWLCERLQVPRAMLAEIVPSSGVAGETTAFGSAIPVAGVCGDQQSALFGQMALQEASCKNTYGTGCFLLMNTGPHEVASKAGLLTTVAWDLGEGATYALEGSVFIGGAVVQWLRDELKMIGSSEESERVAAEVEDAGGVYVVPAFVGLGAPYWDMHARGAVVGLTRGSGRAQIVRAALESISFQSAEVVQCMEKDMGHCIAELRVDGGASRNDLLMQHQADVLGIPVVRGKVAETTALGTAYLAGLAVGFWKGTDELESLWQEDRTFEPRWDEDRRAREMAGWRRAVKMVRSTE